MTDEPDRSSADFHPRVFISYSSAQGHNEWVLRLASRLVSNGVDVILDQWEATLGADLPHFMEQGLTGADRVIAVCSAPFIMKANAGERGVGYEKKIMTASLTANATSDHIVPVIRDASGPVVVPTFLSGTRYVDFRDDAEWDIKYTELLYDLYGQKIKRKPPLGANPFAANSSALTAQQLQFDPTSYASPAGAGTVTFPYTNNNGKYTVGSGVEAFTLKVSTAGPGAVHIYNDPENISSVALAVATPLESVESPNQYDGSSRSRTARVGDSVVLINTTGRVAVVEIIEVTTRDTAVDHVPRLTIRYAIADPSD